MLKHYILDGHNVVEVKGENWRDSLLEWGKWMQTSNRIVEQTEFNDGTYVSTVFLGLDHGFDPDAPLLFETMVFPSRKTLRDEEMRQYCTWDEAKAGHDEMVQTVKIRTGSEVKEKERKDKNG